MDQQQMSERIAALEHALHAIIAKLENNRMHPADRCTSADIMARMALEKDIRLVSRQP